MKSKQIFKIILPISLTAALSLVSCGSETSSENSSSSDTKITETQNTEPETQEMTTEEITEIQEITSAEEISVEETSVEETSAPETAEEETENAEITEISNIPTNAELISMINKAFSIINDGTDEGNFQAAKDWDIIDSTDIHADAPITPDFLISSAMRATGFVDSSSSMAEILESALQHGVINSLDISEITPANAEDIIEKAKYAWSHEEFDNNIHVELADGVVDLTEVITPDDYTIDGNTIKISTDNAELIKEGTVYILPKNPETKEGGAYKAQSVTFDEAGMLTIESVPAEFTEVYSGIVSN